MDQDLEQLLLLRDMTRKTGILHHAQVTQMKYYPLMLLTHTTKAEVNFNYEDSEVIYNIVETKGKVPKDLAMRLKLLGKYTQTLLGDEYQVSVVFKEKVLLRLKGDPDVRRKKRKQLASLKD